MTRLEAVVTINTNGPNRILVEGKTKMMDQTTPPADLENNPLLVTEGLPHYDKIEPDHVLPAAQFVLAEAEENLMKLEETIQPTWEGCVVPLEEISKRFQWAWSPVGHLHGVKNSPELREVYEQGRPHFVTFGLRVGQSEPVYRALKGLREGEEWAKLDEAQRRIVETHLRDMELSGIGLTGEQRERFNEIANDLSKLATDFSNHVLDATKAFSMELTDPQDVEGLPPSTLALAAQSYNTASDLPSDEPPRNATAESGPWRFTLDIPSFLPFMKHSRNRGLREKMYRAYITRASEGEFDNGDIITQILRLRKEHAELLGYATFAEVSLSQKMAPNVAAVEEMFQTLREAAWEPAKRDLADLQALAEESGSTEPLKNWDITYWSERLREKRFNFTDEELRPYFPLNRVMNGLFDLVERLFDIKVEVADGEAPIWHPDVRFFHIRNGEGAHIASFYLDPYSRPENKQGGAWMATCMNRQRGSDGTVQLPVAHLVCNSTPPVGEQPSLMTFREVETLFHEFGHGLQHMLTTVDYSDAAGINGVEWDAVELPSQFMENWCYHKPTLLGMTAHFETGEPLPEELFEKLCQARTFQSGMQTLRQLNFGMTDIALHHKHDPNGSENHLDVSRRIAKLTSLLEPLPEDRTLCAFQHIFAGGYAAGYYSYKWAEVLSADAFSAFEEVGLDNEAAVEETGHRFRNTVLALGGGRHPMQVFKDFRGREPKPDALLRHCGLKN